MSQDEIPALLPRIPGHQFVLYGDACSGVPGALHETMFASVNAVIRRLRPQPEFILFPVQTRYSTIYPVEMCPTL